MSRWTGPGQKSQALIGELLVFDTGARGARYYTHDEQPAWDAWHVVAYDVTYHTDGITLVPASVQRSCWVAGTTSAFIATFQHAVFSLLLDPTRASSLEYVMRPGKPHAVRLTRIPLYDQGEIT